MTLNNGNVRKTLMVDGAIRRRVGRLSGVSTSKCFQCATCSAVCDLSESNTTFPRKQMQYAQLGLLGKMKSDPAIWLCHQCNDCSVHCPKDVRPGDVMAAMRALLIAENSVIGLIGRMYENIGSWWPVTVLVPVALWFVFYVLMSDITAFSTNIANFQFETLVPHWMIYTVNIPVFTGALLALGISGHRVWEAWGAPQTTLGMKQNAFIKAITDIVFHRKMTICTSAKRRSAGHVMVMWGFIGALITTTIIAMLLFFSSASLPLPLSHPLKIFGNIAGAFILTGGIYMLHKRWKDPKKMGRTSAFDYYFILLIFAVTATGFGAQFLRITNQQAAALGVYITHLGLALSLFTSLPFSKFSHMWYRLLAETRRHLISQNEPLRYPEPVSASD